MENKCLIIDCGSGYSKAGYSGDIEPTVTIPTVVWHPSNNNLSIEDKSELLFGKKALEAENGVLVHPIRKTKILEWEDYELFVDNLLKNELKIKSEEYGIFMTEPPLTLKSSREKLTEMLFEKFNVPFMFVTNGAVLSSYGACKYSGFVLDCGYDSSRIVPVSSGYPYSSCIKTIDVGGKDISEYMLKLLLKKGYEEKNIKNHINEIKEKYCFVEIDDTSKKKENEITKYNLPDGKEITLDKEKSLCTEILFHPEMIGKEDFGGVANTLCSCISAIDHYTKKKFEGENLIIAGGSTMFEGFSERLNIDIGKYFGGKYKNRMKIITIKERNNLQWIGASIYSLMQIFKGLCTTRKEYDEYGPVTVHNKCFY
jgi:actin-related protein